MKTFLVTEQDASSVADAATVWITDRIKKAIEERDQCVIALAGGSTPKRLYQNLASLPEGIIPWQKVHLIWGDERNVPLDHADSNFDMVRQAMLNRLGKKGPNVYPVPIDPEDPKKTASYYEATLRALLCKQSNAPLWKLQSSFPSIDIVLLGLGDDAHTASLFPETDALQEKNAWVVANWVAKLNAFRITLTYPLLNAAQNVLFLVCGPSKRPALEKIWNEPKQLRQLPAQGIHPQQGELWWFLDADAIESVHIPIAFAKIQCTPNAK